MGFGFTVRPSQGSRLYAKVDTNGICDQDWKPVFTIGKMTRVMRFLVFPLFLVCATACTNSAPSATQGAPEEAACWVNLDCASGSLCMCGRCVVHGHQFHPNHCVDPTLYECDGSSGQCLDSCESPSENLPAQCKANLWICAPGQVLASACPFATDSGPEGAPDASRDVALP